MPQKRYCKCMNEELCRIKFCRPAVLYSVFNQLSSPFTKSCLFAKKRIGSREDNLISIRFLSRKSTIFSLYWLSFITSFVISWLSFSDHKIKHSAARFHFFAFYPLFSVKVSSCHMLSLHFPLIKHTSSNT